MGWATDYLKTAAHPDDDGVGLPIGLAAGTAIGAGAGALMTPGSVGAHVPGMSGLQHGPLANPLPRAAIGGLAGMAIGGGLGYGLDALRRKEAAHPDDEESNALPTAAIAGGGLLAAGGALATHNLGRLEDTAGTWLTQAPPQAKAVLDPHEANSLMDRYITTARGAATTPVLGMPAASLMPTARTVAGMENDDVANQHYRLYADPKSTTESLRKHHLVDLALPFQAGEHWNNPKVFSPAAKSIIDQHGHNPLQAASELRAAGHHQAADVTEALWRGGTVNGKNYQAESHRLLGNTAQPGRVDDYRQKLLARLPGIRAGAIGIAGLGAGLAGYGAYRMMRNKDEEKAAAGRPRPDDEEENNNLERNIGLGVGTAGALGAGALAASTGGNLRKFNPWSDKYQIGLEAPIFHGEDDRTVRKMTEAADELRGEGLHIEVPKGRAGRGADLGTMYDDAAIHVGNPNGNGSTEQSMPITSNVARATRGTYRLHSDMGGSSLLNQPGEYGHNNGGMAGIKDPSVYTRHITPGSSLLGEQSVSKGHAGQLPDLDPGNIAVAPQFEKGEFTPGKNPVPTAVLSMGGGWQTPMALHDAMKPGGWGPNGELQNPSNPDGFDLSRRTVLHDIDDAMRAKHGDNYKVKIHTGIGFDPKKGETLEGNLNQHKIWSQVLQQQAGGKFKNFELEGRHNDMAKQLATPDYHFIVPGATSAEYATMKGQPGRVIAMVPPILGNASPTHHFETNADVMAKRFDDVHKVRLDAPERAKHIHDAVMAPSKAPASAVPAVPPTEGAAPRTPPPPNTRPGAVADWKNPLRTITGDIRAQRFRNLGNLGLLGGATALGAGMYIHSQRDKEEAA